MDEATLKRAVDLLLSSRQRDRLLWFTGGEPLLEFPSLRRAVSYAKAASPAARRVRFGLSTNGLLLDDERGDFLAAHRVSTQISFDGVAAAQDHRGAGSFDRLDACLRRLRRRHPSFFAERVEVAMTVTGANLRVLAESVDCFLDRGVQTVHLAPRVTPDADWTDGDCLELARQLGRVYEASLCHHRRTGQVPVVLLRRGGTVGAMAPADERLCGLGAGRSLAVDVDGSVAGCVMLAESYQTFSTPLLRERVPALRLGALHDPGLSERLDALPAAVAAAGLFDGRSRKHSRFGRCRVCPHRRRCTICPVSIGRIPGNTDPDRVPDLACAFNRIALEYRARFPPAPQARPR
jgi:sulfatase maturation enzyme AslB (radical SAM superfamily)